MVQRPGHYERVSKKNWKHFKCEYGEGWSVQNGQKIKNAVVLERVGERRIMLELIKKRKRN